MSMEQINKKIVKATFEEMSNIAFWQDIITECNEIRQNSTSIVETSEAEQLFCQAEHIIHKLNGDL